MIVTMIETSRYVILLMLETKKKSTLNIIYVICIYKVICIYIYIKLRIRFMS